MKTPDRLDNSEPPTAWRDFVELKQLLRALGDVVRLNIVHALAEGGEVKVTDLAERLAVSQPLVSWNLTVLRHVGLVVRRRQGREVYCSLDRERFEECMRLLATVAQPQDGHAATRASQLRAPARTDTDQPESTTGKVSDRRAPRSPPATSGP